MEKNSIAIAKAYRLINYGPVVLVSSAHENKQNIAAIACVTHVSSDPVLIAVAVARGHLSSELIKKSQEFVVNVPSYELLDQVMICGKNHGRDINKFEKSGLTPVKADQVSAPLIEECSGHLECKLEQTVETGDHFLFIGKLVAASVDPAIWLEDNMVDISKFKTLSHLGGKSFASLS